MTHPIVIVVFLVTFFLSGQVQKKIGIIAVRTKNLHRQRVYFALIIARIAIIIPVIILIIFNSSVCSGAYEGDPNAVCIPASSNMPPAIALTIFIIITVIYGMLTLARETNKIARENNKNNR